ncbi:MULTISPECIES: helix-turn-helix domain-containing protein [Aerococcus]|uniref:Helix-turn-helix domain-containing protein n=2 Tax=Aerococcus TaxID=1375 RepID=A0A1E9PI72_9LACT|nr:MULTISPECIES: helix-turn-helix transcriptional regulator [Aerococcus]MBU5610966.1 helix-turn-helix domain-containing protein [Aerococcus urinae]MCY3034039.1 helix-turn-helix domain-containing protein [Aerococcus mictus]MCY3065807.1 helix-turn-helix domain-containing protein [Aerococcus mictus]MCY3066437.1 helix-turn-helix domain-containing protein [Aerococcus mictus]MCY3071362.1 helix-turn-helix domain-containing protein [Aerococcus mictus]
MSNNNNEQVKSFIAKKIKEKREERGLSQKELAETVNIVPTTISYYETGRRTPSADSIFLIANALDSDISEFYPPSTNKKYYSDFTTEIKNNVYKEAVAPYELYDREMTNTNESSEENINEFFNLLNTENKLNVFYFIQSLYKDQNKHY